MVNTKKSPIPPQAVVRLRASDRKIVEELKAKTGIDSLSDLIRTALRALASKEGVMV